jgi:hypothetical protein
VLFWLAPDDALRLAHFYEAGLVAIGDCNQDPYVAGKRQVIELFERRSARDELFDLALSLSRAGFDVETALTILARLCGFHAA